MLAMRALLASLMSVTAVLVSAHALPDSGDRQNPADGSRALKERLLDLAEDRLRPMQWFLDRSRAQLVLSSPLPSGTEFEVTALWPTDGSDVPEMPLAFDLRPRLTARAPTDTSIHATLSAPLMRDVAVAARRLHKQSSVQCSDLSVSRMPARSLPKRPLLLPCEVAARAVALREVAAGDILRADDIGAPFDVVEGAHVTLRLISGGVMVDAAAVALTDARVGDTAEVRMDHPTRTFKARVTGRSMVDLLDNQNE
jgi:flagella basal body P-ring formation protein FlgA